MSETSRNLAIGSFVVGAIVILIGFLLFMAGGGFGRETVGAVMVFENSVKGLKVGAPVAFKGVQIGQVKDIDLQMDLETYKVSMPVEVELISDAFDEVGEGDPGSDRISDLIDQGMRAQLQLESLLTGLLYIQLDFYPNTEVNMARVNSEMMQFPTIPTDMEKLSRSLDNLDFQTLVSDISNAMSGIDTLINDPRTQDLPEQLHTTLMSLETLSQDLSQQTQNIGPDLNQLISTTDQTMHSLQSGLPRLTDEAVATLTSAQDALAALRDAMASVDYELSGDSATLYELQQAARETSAAMRALRTLAENIDEQPESLIKGRSQDKAQ